MNPGVARDCYYHYQSTKRNTFSNSVRKKLYRLFAAWSVALCDIIETDFKQSWGRNLSNIRVSLSQNSHLTHFRIHIKERITKPSLRTKLLIWYCCRSKLQVITNSFEANLHAGSLLLGHYFESVENWEEQGPFKWISPYLVHPNKKISKEAHKVLLSFLEGNDLI